MDLNVVDLSRMKMHELRDAAKNKILCPAPSFNHTLVGAMLDRRNGSRRPSLSTT